MPVVVRMEETRFINTNNYLLIRNSVIISINKIHKIHILRHSNIPPKALKLPIKYCTILIKSYISSC